MTEPHFSLLVAVCESFMKWLKAASAAFHNFDNSIKGRIETEINSF